MRSTHCPKVQCYLKRLEPTATMATSSFWNAPAILPIVEWRIVEILNLQLLRIEGGRFVAISSFHYIYVAISSFHYIYRMQVHAIETRK